MAGIPKASFFVHSANIFTVSIFLTVSPFKILFYKMINNLICFVCAFYEVLFFSGESYVFNRFIKVYIH